VAKWVGPNEPALQPVLKGTGWVEDFNSSAPFGPFRLARLGPFCPVRQLDRPKYELARPSNWLVLKKLNKIKVIKRLFFLYYIF